jgi:arylsulfatase A-like enzyme
MSSRHLAIIATIVAGLAMTGCQDPAAVEQTTAKVVAVQATENESLFDNFANLARQEAAAQVQPQALPGDDEEPPIFPPDPVPVQPVPGLQTEGEDPLDAEQILNFFASEEWQELKASNARAVANANRQLRVEACQDMDVVLIVIDGLGYGDVGVYGQRQIKTPNIDMLAQTGIRFTNYYSGSSVQMPSHDSILTGRHTGHTRVRGNRDTATLAPQDYTLAEMMYMAGFTTAMLGSWELGDEQTPGTPIKQGFEETYGYLNHTHADDYFPQFLYRNDERQPIPGNLNNGRGNYSFDLVVKETLDYLERGHARPFFLMLSLTPPRGDLDDVPSLEPYGSEDWPEEQKQYAAMIGRVDEAVGEIMDRAYQRQQIRPILIILTSSNGPRKDGIDPNFFDSNGPFEGVKGTLHEGGIRVPMIIWGPELLTASGSVNHTPWAAWDVMPTLGELVGAWRVPKYIDGVSQVGFIRGRMPPKHQPFYWELHEDGFVQAVRDGKWKAIRDGLDGPIKLFNIVDDPKEEDDVANAYPDVVKEMADHMASARNASPDWPVAAE